MKISIIMPSLNVAKYIGKCLESVLNQTLKGIEIICVDAGSTDGTLEIINEFAQKDNRIKLINSPIKSYGYQMNLGIRATCGEYIGIVETDDFIDKNMYEELYSYVIDNQVDFVKSSYFEYTNKTIKEVNLPHSKLKVVKRHGDTIILGKEPEYRLADTMHIWSGIYRREFLLKNDLFFNETPGASFQDVSFSILVGLMAETCIYVDRCYYHYRIDNENSSVKSASKITCVCDEYRYIEKYLEQKNMLSEELIETLSLLKLETYTWNYSRLSDDYKCIFIDFIEKEMKCYNPDELNDKYRLMYDMLTDKNKISEFNVQETQQKEWNQQLISSFKSGEKFNVIGAGNIFKILFGIQEYIDIKFIDVVADNSASIQKKVISGYTVFSLEEAIKKNDNKWLIASLYYGEEIKNQLIQQGIPQNKIILLDKMCGFSQMIDKGLI